MYDDLGKYSVGDATTISLDSPFTVVPTPGKLKIPDNKQTQLWIDQEIPERLFVSCLATFTSDSTLLTIDRVLSTSVNISNTPILNITIPLAAQDSTTYGFTVTGQTHTAAHSFPSDASATISEILIGLKADVDGDGSATWSATIVGDELVIETEDANNLAFSAFVLTDYSRLPAFIVATALIDSNVSARVFDNLVGSEGFDVFACAGDSSMAAVGSCSNRPQPESALDPKLYSMIPHDMTSVYGDILPGVIGPVGLFQLFYAPMSFITDHSSIRHRQTTEPAAFVHNSTGIPGGFGRSYIINTGLGRRSLILGYALGSTLFGSGGLFGADGDWRKSVSTLYPIWLEGINIALSDGVSDLRAFLWHAGPNDAVEETPDFQAKLTGFISDIRGDITPTSRQTAEDFLKVPFLLGTLPKEWIFGQDGNTAPSQAAIDTIDAALKAIHITVPYTATISTSNLLSDNTLGDKKIHLEGNGQVNKLGVWFHNYYEFATRNNLIAVVPGTVADLSVNAKSQSGEFIWTPPKSVGMTKHVLEIDVTGGGFSPALFSYDPDATAHEFTSLAELTNGVVYDAQIKGSNDGVTSDGAFSSIVTFTPGGVVVPKSELAWPGVNNVNGYLTLTGNDLTQWEDISANGAHGTRSNTITRVNYDNGVADDSVVFDAVGALTSDHGISLANTAATGKTIGDLVDLSTGSFTALFRVRTTTSHNGGAFMSMVSDDVNADGWRIRMLFENGINDLIQITDTDGGAYVSWVLGSGGDSVLNDWITFAVTFDSTIATGSGPIKIFKGWDANDFVLEDSSSTTVQAAMIPNSNALLEVGEAHLAQAASNFYGGHMANVEVFNFALDINQLKDRIRQWDDSVIPVPTGL
jgi:hypothetical protein